MSIFRSFRSTVTPFLSRMWPTNLRLLVDPVTGSPAGVENPNANGPDGIWAPVDLTAAQIAAPTTAMIADLNATYRLNVAPYSRYRSDGSTLVEMAATSDAPVFTGPVAIGGAATAGAVLTTHQSATQISADYHYNDFFGTATYTADSSTGANLGVVSTLFIYENGHHYSATHSAALYGTAQIAGASPSGLVDQINGIEGSAGNGGSGTLTNAVAFYAHYSFNSGAGTITNDYAFYHQTNTGAFGASPATNGYGFYINAPSGIGTNTPTAYLDIRATNSLSTTTEFLVRSSTGNILMITADGVVTQASLAGAGGFGTMIVYAPVTVTASNPTAIVGPVSVRSLPA